VDEVEDTVEVQSFVTRPDLAPPVIDVRDATAPSEGLLFLGLRRAGAQQGPVIVDDAGELVWSRPTGEVAATDVRVQTYEGEPVLTWYEGASDDGHGTGEFVIADTAYEEVARVRAGAGLDGDLHEFQLTDRGTALVLAYSPTSADLTALAGPEDGVVLDNHVQEIDVATGEVLFDWRALDHVPLTDSYRELVPDAAATADGRDEDGSEDAPFDWFHGNSVADDADGTVLVSARNTHAVYQIDTATGAVNWTLGGRSSDFALGDGATFAWQHDARRRPDGTISLFDNAANPPTADESRGIVVRLDEDGGTATLLTAFAHPDEVLAGSQGNLQLLADGGAVIGWGSEGGVTEFDAGGEVVFDAWWAPARSYRVYRMPWVGEPTTSPDVVAESVDTGVDVHVSWNGATEVAEWRLLVGDDPDALEPVATVARDGFETRIADATGEGPTHLAVEALDAGGEVIGTSEVVEPGGS
jgi:hypothetical protein